MTSLCHDFSAMAKETDGDDKKKNTSLRLDKKMLKTLKRHALENETSVQQIVEKLIENYLKRKYPRSGSGR
jgi:hypothetical protein